MADEAPVAEAYTEPYEGPSSEQVREWCDAHVGHAQTMARVWRDWAAGLDHLTGSIPSRPGVLYIDDCLERSSLDLGVDHIDVDRMRDALNRVRAEADALAMAYRRGAAKAKRLNDGTVALVEGLEAAATEGGESHG